MAEVPDPQVLRAAAAQVVQHAHVPASGFAVGAAVSSADGRVFVGCNVENASYGLTICAERAAVCAMVAAGARQLAACLIHTPQAARPSPCGACCQVLAEFGDGDLPLYLLGSGGVIETARLRDFLPRPFRFDAQP